MTAFRFIAQVPDIGASVATWRDDLARIEGMGFGTVALADHFTGGYQWEPIVTLTAAAMATTLRVKLVELRERLGISYIQIHAGPRSVDLQQVRPVIAALTGT